MGWQGTQISDPDRGKNHIAMEAHKGYMRGVCTQPLNNEGGTTMGLEEKRLMQQFQEVILPKFRNELKTMAGVDIPIEMDVTGFANDANALKYLEDQTRELINTLRSLMSDAVGAQAVKDGVKKIVIKNAGSGQKGLSLKDGIVELVTSCGKGLEGYVKDSEMKKVLENAL